MERMNEDAAAFRDETYDGEESCSYDLSVWTERVQDVAQRVECFA
jgi:hypothetical protein